MSALEPSQASEPLPFANLAPRLLDLAGTVPVLLGLQEWKQSQTLQKRQVAPIPRLSHGSGQSRQGWSSEHPDSARYKEALCHQLFRGGALLHRLAAPIREAPLVLQQQDCLRV